MPSRTFTVLTLAIVLVLGVAAGWYFKGDDKMSPSTQAGPVTVGQPIPDLTVKALDGSSVSLSALKGRPVWITFGASWCAPCRAEAPDLQAAYEAHQARGLAIVAVYLSEDEAAVRHYSSTLKLTYTHVPDPKSQLASGFGVNSIPVHFFVDAQGVLRQRKEGGMSRSAMETALEGIGA